MGGGLTTGDRPGLLLRLLGIRPHEASRTGLLFLLSFVLGLSLVSIDVALSARLVLDLAAGDLPWSHVVIALATPLAGLSLSALRKRLSLVLYATIPLAVTALLFLALLSAYSGETPVVLLGLWALQNTLTAVALIGFWTIAAQTFSVEQSSRLYGIISAGEVIAGVIGGLAAGTLGALLSFPALLMVALGGVMLAVLLTVPLARGATFESEPHNPEVSATLSTIFRRHTTWCIVYYGFSNITYDVLSFLVLLGVQRSYPDQPEAVAGVLGALTALRLALSALLRLLIAGRFFQRFGVGAGLFSTPVTVAALALTALALHPLPLLPVAIALQTSESIARGGIGKPAFMVAQRPLPTGPRERTLLLIETAVEPATTGLAGVALLLVPDALLSGVTLLVLPLPGALLWLVAAGALHQSYQRLLRGNQEQHP